MSYRVPYIAALGFCFAIAASAQMPKSSHLFEQHCISCHPNVAAPGQTAPDAPALRKKTPEAIVAALSNGAAHEPARQLSRADQVAIAEYLNGRNYMGNTGDAKQMPNACANNPQVTSITNTAAWNGWGVDTTNGRFQAKGAGIPANRVSQLKLKWAFGFPGATAVYGQPTVVGGRVLVSLNNGFVYSLDAKTGCAYWSFQARSGVRNAISVGEIKGHSGTRFAAYFGDVRANVYAIDFQTGKQLWEAHVDENTVAGITGAPALFEGRLYVPTASREEAAGTSALYPCCTFRGAIVALDANNGKQIWKSYVITEEPKPSRKNDKGVQMYGPAGGAVWNTPTIDAKNRALYVGTGNTYTEPPAANTDAILAMSLDTGKILWSVQDTPSDSWLACNNAWGVSDNCPKDMGPDYDFGASPILRTLPSGKRVLIAGQKSGMVWAHDPDNKGAVVWKTQVPEKLSLGEITFGGAADEQYAYFGVSSVGVVALNLVNGELKWTAPIKAAGPRLGVGAALSVIPGAVFGGGYDGILRGYSTTNGELLFQYNMVKTFETLNKVDAKGGSMGAPGPTIANGMMYVGSGYIFGERGTPGNVLLAFGAE